MSKNMDVLNAGANIKARLAKKGIKQKALACVWGVKESPASKLLSGKARISAERLFAAAEFLGCSVYELIDGTDGDDRG